MVDEDTNGITIAWSTTELQDGHTVQTETELTFSKHDAQVIIRGLLTGRYDASSPKGIQERLKKRATRVEVEKHHYEGMGNSNTEYASGWEIKENND